MDTELLEKWDTYQPEKHGLFNTMKVTDAYQYVDDIIEAMPKEQRFVAYTAAYVMYNSVINHYETNMICTKRENEDENREAS
jgi:hypothetical protein